MTSYLAKLNECNHAEEPARVLLEWLGWAYTPWETLQSPKGARPRCAAVGAGAGSREGRNGFRKRSGGNQ